MLQCVRGSGRGIVVYLSFGMDLLLWHEVPNIKTSFQSKILLIISPSELKRVFSHLIHNNNVD